MSAIKSNMADETDTQLAGFIWSICNLLRGPYKRNEYRKVILPLTVLRRFDCILEPTKVAVLNEHAAIKAKPENIVRHKLSAISGHAFYNLSKFTIGKPREGSGLNGVLDDPNHLAPNLNSYINGFSANVRAIMDKFEFGAQIAKMAEKDLLYLVIKKFAAIDLSPARVDNVQMGYVFEELIRIGAEQSNEEAGEHFTPREVIKLMVNLLLAPEKDLARSHVVKTIYDPACGTGGMLSVAEKYIRDLNADAQPKLFGQDWNDEAWAVCKSDMLSRARMPMPSSWATRSPRTVLIGGWTGKNGLSTTCWPTRRLEWSGSSSRNTWKTNATPSVLGDVSAPAHPA